MGSEPCFRGSACFQTRTGNYRGSGEELCSPFVTCARPRGSSAAGPRTATLGLGQVEPADSETTATDQRRAINGPAPRPQGCVARVGQVHRLSVGLFFNWLHSETQPPAANTVHEPGDDGPLKARDQGLSGLFTCSW